MVVELVLSVMEMVVMVLGEILVVVVLLLSW